jgi:type II secretory pathway component PulK
MRRLPNKESQSGIAMLMVLVSVAVLTVLAFELSYSTGVQSRLARTFHAAGQAKYLAKSALNISLIRLFVYLNFQSLLEKVKGPLGPQELANIYEFPLPPFPFSGEYLALFPVAVRIGLEKFTRESAMGTLPGAQFSADIRGLSDKMPVNFLDGEPERFSSGKFQNLYKDLMTQLIENDRLNDEQAWEDKHGEVMPDDLVWGLINYIDTDNLEQPGSTLEEVYFQQLDPPEFLRHRRIRFPSELTLPRHWTRDLARRYTPFLNFYAFYPYLNMNKISSRIWKALLVDADETQLQAVQERIGERAFGDAKDLEEFMSVQDLKLKEEFKLMSKIMKFGEQVAFEIRSTGIIGDIRKEFSTLVVLKPALSLVQQSEDAIKKLSLESQQKMLEANDFENPEFLEWRQDPFGFFPKEESAEDREKRPEEKTPAPEEGDEGQPQAPSDREPKAKKSIFEESPETLQIVYWGAPI